MTDKNQEPSPFTRAIESLESGDTARAEALFKQTIKELGPTNNQSLLSYKSLISLATEDNNYTKALNISLDLLDAQIQALGIRHSDCTRTLNNIHTLCNTLGNKELAEEIMAMAREAERATVATSVKRLRTNDELLEEEEEKELPGARTIFMMPIAPIKDWVDSLGEKIKSTLSILLLVGVPVVLFAIFGVLYLLGLQSSGDGALAAGRTYLAGGGLVSLTMDGGKAVFNLGDRKITQGYQAFSGSDFDLGRLMLAPPWGREYWMELRPEGLVNAAGLMFYRADSPELEIISHMQNVMVAADRCYREERSYPESFNKDDVYHFDYDNPFTSRLDYPVVTSVKLPDKRFKDRNQLFAYLRAGGTWPGEPAIYPGAINCGHIVSETQTSYFDDFVVHGCNRLGRPFKGTDGTTLLFVSERGTLKEQPPMPATGILASTGIYVWTGAQSPGIFLLANRLCLFYGALAIAYLALGRLLKEPKSRLVANLLGFVALVVTILNVMAWTIKL